MSEVLSVDVLLSHCMSYNFGPQIRNRFEARSCLVWNKNKCWNWVNDEIKCFYLVSFMDRVHNHKTTMTQVNGCIERT